MQAEFQTYAIDLLQASTSSVAQIPITFESDSSNIDGPISFLGVTPYGRFGNNIYQVINAFCIARALNIPVVLFDGFDFGAENTSAGIELKFDTNFQGELKCGLRGQFYAPHGFESIFKPQMRGEKELENICHMLASTYRDIIHKSIRKKSIAMHFRGGDVFVEAPHHFYVQPPASYYIKCFDHACKNAAYDAVELVYEDRKNPAIEVVENNLIERGIAFNSRSSTVAGDVSRLLSADCIISSYGTFCEGAAWLSRNLKAYYCFRGSVNQDTLHPFSQTWVPEMMSARNMGFYICDDFDLTYINPKSWRNSDDQQEMIRYFSSDFLRIYKYN